MTTPVDKRWTYCPECGSTEIRHAEGDHKQCACCLQEWFADIDYTDVVRTNLGNRMQLRSSLTAKDKQAKELRECLSELVDLMEGVREGDYMPDCFTCQPARLLLNKERT